MSSNRDKIKSIADAAEAFREGQEITGHSQFNFQVERENRPERFMEVVADYKAGMSCKDIEAKHKCTHSTIMRYARLAGLPKRPKHFDPSIRTQAIELYKSGLTAHRVAELVGVSDAYMSKLVNELGIKRKKT